MSAKQNKNEYITILAHLFFLQEDSKVHPELYEDNPDWLIDSLEMVGGVIKNGALFADDIELSLKQSRSLNDRNASLIYLLQIPISLEAENERKSDK